MADTQETEEVIDEREKATVAAEHSEKPEHPLANYTLTGKFLGSPYHIFCAGCGYGAIAMAIINVLKEYDAAIQRYPFVTGIGCYSSMPTLLSERLSITALHGRALPIATGIKLANPDFKPIVITGDGDCLAIGAGHFVNACRRNLDAVVIMLHNNVFGMTGGQLAPTMAPGNNATTAPYGSIEDPFDAVELAIAAGATYVARWTLVHIRDFMRSFSKALKHKGLSFIEMISPCPTYYGRQNGFPEPIDLFREIRDNSIHIKDAHMLSKQDKSRKYIIGEFKEESRPELSDNYQKLIQIAQG